MRLRCPTAGWSGGATRTTGSTTVPGIAIPAGSGRRTSWCWEIRTRTVLPWPPTGGRAEPRRSSDGASTTWPCPGMGLGHSLLQLDEALALTPRLVVVAPYFGNDFFETHVLARRHPQLLAGIDPALREAAAAEDRRRAIEQEVGRLFAVAAAQRAQHWVSSHMKLYGLARALRTHLSSPPATPAILSRDFALAAAALTPDERRYASPLDAGTWRTVLTSAYRHQVLDDSDPRIRLGFEAARAALLTMHERCRAAGIPLLVVLLPTKESVFWPRVRDPAAHPGLEGLVANEARLRGELIAALAAREIPHVNVLRPLRSSPAQTYFEDVDGHPNATGHAVIAATVTEHARRLLR